MATDFLSKLKNHYEVKVNPSHSHVELREDFAAEMKGVFESYLSALHDSLEDINYRALNFLNKIEHQSVGAQDNVNKNFEIEVSYEIKNWIASDETLRAKFTKIQVLYSKKLKPTDMEEILQRELAALENAIAKNVTIANAYGKNWTELMDNIGMVALQNETKMTIEWFKNVSVEELRRSFNICT